MGVAAFTRARDRLLAAQDAELPSGAVCETIVHAVRDLCEFQWSAVMSTDPATLLPAGGVVHGFSADACAPFWENELLDPDFNKFAELARRVDPVATLAEALDGDLERSQRYTKLYAALGAADELRVAFTAGSSCLAVGAFLRSGEHGLFTPEQVADVRALVPIAAKALRSALGRLQAEVTHQAPVVIMLDGDGEVTWMTEGAQQVLDDLRVNSVDGDFPGVVKVAAAKARWSRTSTNLTTRLRGRSGRWLRLHVSPIEGEVGPVVVTIETARPDDLALTLLDSYGLTDRETEIALRLCRGLSAKNIAADLLISAHTVRDHVKAIYDKAGVNSRGELVASLFSNHVLDRFHDAVTHVA